MPNTAFKIYLGTYLTSGMPKPLKFQFLKQKIQGYF